jgi:hypothetical protein
MCDLLTCRSRRERIVPCLQLNCIITTRLTHNSLASVVEQKYLPESCQSLASHMLIRFTHAPMNANVGGTEHVRSLVAVTVAFSIILVRRVELHDEESAIWKKGSVVDKDFIRLYGR